MKRRIILTAIISVFCVMLGGIAYWYIQESKLLASPGNVLVSPSGEYETQIVKEKNERGKAYWKVNVMKKGVCVASIPKRFYSCEGTFIAWDEEHDKLWMYCSETKQYYLCEPGEKDGQLWKVRKPNSEELEPEAFLHFKVRASASPKSSLGTLTPTEKAQPDRIETVGAEKAA